MSAPDKNVDKMGYMSVMVGDGAAELNRHLVQYGHDYGLAARQFRFTLDGGRHVLRTGQGVLESLQFGYMPWMALGWILQTSVTVWSQLQQAKSSQQQQQALQQQLQQQHQFNAQHLLLLQASSPDAVQALVETTCLYAQDHAATAVHLVVTDSYLAAQVRLYLQKHKKKQPQPQQKDDSSIASDTSQNNMQVFVSLQEAFDQASNSSSSKVLIYVHSLQQLHLHHNLLQIHNCNDFVLMADHHTVCNANATAAGGGPRLILNGHKVDIQNSRGTIQSVAFSGGWPNHNQQEIQFVQCTTTTNNSGHHDSSSTSRNNKKSDRLHHHQKKQQQQQLTTTRIKVGLLFASSAFVTAVSFTCHSIFFRHHHDRNHNGRRGPTSN
ncbi:expressed unknown protein [Seminavis robusta]|uniref:Uncharacterized protein n=1 Tax=Seminavis robusta TaxID=568900 RepID=A0A9N8ECW6_9STRA|nr:expressed unknown protein [Seminavis robusta]|eukprot:Sro768_g199620.1 n/a (381) ;mRNA; r:16774-17916